MAVYSLNSYLSKVSQAWQVGEGDDLAALLSFQVGVFHGTRYRVFFLTGPPHFQYRKEKRLSANQSCCYVKFFIKESLWLARWPLFFYELNGEGGQLQTYPWILLTIWVALLSQLFLKYG